MTSRDLGELSGTVVLWGGALGNLSALMALESEVSRLGVPPDRVICTGDIAGYGAEGATCVDRVRASGWTVVAGNVEEGLATGRADCGCGFDAGSACDRLSGPWWTHAIATIGEGARAWMRGLPDLVAFSHGGKRHAVIHGGQTDRARFLWPVSRQPEFAQEIAAIESAVGPVNAVVAGHCGIAFSRIAAGRHWINAGAIGMPPNNGVPGGQFVVLDGQGAHIRRLNYDPAPSVTAMRRAGLTQGYDRALLSGIWPSQEVLPLTMRRRGAQVEVPEIEGGMPR
ncbi:metallophosphoesterase [Maritimibacter sp. DP1N21-5]|uniref:metallophosphoesterase family protein n=1 Tax=Maritimibacter sp. DP1N21-5 TaxID=2836867 RepID=UPI001C491A9E|nr:metallophosphoesterase family protein [Maritimibacter sp. DP1N21-5]MBV7409702.1 metallophosphoesterase [Maritimibacter sp. DP1N21-5]